MSEVRSRVLIIDDNDDLSTMLTVLIGHEHDLECVGRLASADLLLESIAEHEPDILLMDLTMPGRDPLEAMSAAAARYPQCRAIVLSGYDDPDRVEAAVNSGAWGFVSKDGQLDMILKAIRAVRTGEVYLQGRNG